VLHAPRTETASTAHIKTKDFLILTLFPATIFK